MVLGLKEGLVECATVCVKSVVILLYLSSDVDDDGKLISRPRRLTLIIKKVLVG